MSCRIDWRKITERKLTVSSCILSVVALGISTKSCTHQGRAVCLSVVSSKFDTLKGDLQTLPSLLSACAIEPKAYCDQARNNTLRLTNLIVDIEGEVGLPEALAKVKSGLNKGNSRLNNRDDESTRRDNLIELAESLNTLRSELNKISIADLGC